MSSSEKLVKATNDNTETIGYDHIKRHEIMNECWIARYLPSEYLEQFYSKNPPEVLLGKEVGGGRKEGRKDAVMQKFIS